MRKKDVQIVALAGVEIAGWCDVTRMDLPGLKLPAAPLCGTKLLYAFWLKVSRGELLSVEKNIYYIRLRILRRARENGLSRVELEVFASNEIAIRLYLEAEFVMEGRKIGARILDGRTDDVCLMALNLPEKPGPD